MKRIACWTWDSFPRFGVSPRFLPKERQTMCFSATMEGAMTNLVKDYTRNPVRLAFGPLQSRRKMCAYKRLK